MLTKFEKTLILKTNALSNKVLYDLCAEYPFNCYDKDGYNKIDALAAQLLLIGRTYAASPQRRSYKNKSVIFSNAANGKDDFFVLLAKELYKKREFYDASYSDSLVSRITELKSSEFKFDCSQKDITLLIKSVECVLYFNKLLREAVYEIDKPDLEKISATDGGDCGWLINFVSFSSKFLHFHCPDAIFIIDTISSNNFRQEKLDFGRGYKFRFSNGMNEIESSIVISFDTEQTVKIKIEKQLQKNENLKGHDYLTHCIREYLLAKEIYKEIQSENLKGKSITRIVDDYILNVIKKTKSKN